MLVTQDVFSTKGYSHAGLRESAAKAEVTASLLIKYFGTNAKLLEEVLVAAIHPSRHFQSDRTKLGEAIVAAFLDPQSPMQSPAMIALTLAMQNRGRLWSASSGNDVDPMTLWLDNEDARVRAINILAMTMRFSIFHRNMGQFLSESERRNSGQCFARSLQDLVDLA
ncbi:TetR family transcriptional regulator [Novosphingobium malaysiense]|uniref:HTH tetR-type domain-containing protein n=1 Tax=Novosphingobium malaysiense TaxID=1348853 RepID=A0A0B1ZIC0_9SPHN|nr:TetR family transcriptional regulator [Novosphingobium malaysiense]KHK90257.1 hypothetical protein LK12_16580 [Novosphingobium malaysiense]